MCVCVGLQDDMRHFHGTYKAVCDRHDPAFYPRFKKWADEYFTIKFAPRPPHPPPPRPTPTHRRILPRWRITEARAAAGEGGSGGRPLGCCWCGGVMEVCGRRVVWVVVVRSWR